MYKHAYKQIYTCVSVNTKIMHFKRIEYYANCLWLREYIYTYIYTHTLAKEQTDEHSAATQFRKPKESGEHKQIHAQVKESQRKQQ